MKLFVPYFCILLISLVLWCLPLSSAYAQTQPRTVRVGVYENPPKIYTDKNGNVTGVFGDILSIIAIKENWKLEYVPGTFDEGLERLKSGKIDIMPDVAFDAQRNADYRLSDETVLSSWGVIYTRKNSSISSFADLDRKTIAIVKSSIYRGDEGGLDQYAGAFHLHLTYVELPEYDEAFKLLSEGRVDAAMVSRISGITAEPTYKNIRPTDIIIKPTELRFSLTKNSQDSEYLAKRLDYWVTQLRDGYGGIYRKILEKHNLLGLTPEVQVVPAWVLPFTLGANAALLVSWTITVIFGYWNKKTRDTLAQMTKRRK